MSRSRARQPRRPESVVLAIADIELAEALLGENCSVMKRLIAELATVKARLAVAARLLAKDHGRT